MEDPNEAVDSPCFAINRPPLILEEDNNIDLSSNISVVNNINIPSKPSEISHNAEHIVSQVQGPTGMQMKDEEL